MTEWSNKVIANPEGVWQSPFYGWDCFALLAMTEWSNKVIANPEGVWQSPFHE